MSARPSPPAGNDLDVGPAHALADARAERLQHGLLRGEAARHVLVRTALAEAVVPLALREQHVDDAGVLGDEAFHPADADDVHADPETQTRNLRNLRAARPCPRGSGR